MERNVRLYPWFKLCQSLMFWQAVWFLYFQKELSAAEALMLYVILDLCTTVFEVPSGYMSDRIGRRITLILAAIAGAAGAAMQAVGEGFWVFAAAQVLVGMSFAFASGTDSSLLYESLAASGRKEEVERQELKAWRFQFWALALSAFLGGVLALRDPALAYWATAASFLATLAITLLFREPGVTTERSKVPMGSLGAAMTNPVLAWIFGLTVAMYVFSHVPFAYGQPFILEALRGVGYDGEAPLVSGVVTAIMMIASLAVSQVAEPMRRAMGLPRILLLAFAMQIGLIAVLSASNAPLVIGLLFLRMVPNAISQPFILARIQPELVSESRATYLSIQSFTGRLLLALSLWIASFAASESGEMSYAEMQPVLAVYAVIGVLVIGGLAALTGRVRIEPEDKSGG